MAGHYECNGCINCCRLFPVDKETYEETQMSHPGLLYIVDRKKDGDLLVDCNKAVHRDGCQIHPKRIGREIRPSFCQAPITGCGLWVKD